MVKHFTFELRKKKKEGVVIHYPITHYIKQGAMDRTKRTKLNQSSQRWVWLSGRTRALRGLEAMEVLT